MSSKNQPNAEAKLRGITIGSVVKHGDEGKTFHVVKFDKEGDPVGRGIYDCAHAYLCEVVLAAPAFSEGDKVEAPNYRAKGCVLRIREEEPRFLVGLVGTSFSTWYATTDLVRKPDKPIKVNAPKAPTNQAKMLDKQRHLEKKALQTLSRDATSVDDYERMGKELAMLAACMLDNARASKDEMYFEVRKALGLSLD